DHVQAALHSVLVLDQDEMHVASVAGNRVELHISAYAQPLIHRVGTKFLQFRDFLVVAGSLVDAAGREPSQRPQDHSYNQPKLDIFVHGKSSPSTCFDQYQYTASIQKPWGRSRAMTEDASRPGIRRGDSVHLPAHGPGLEV